MYTYVHSTRQCSSILLDGSKSAEASAPCDLVSTQLKAYHGGRRMRTSRHSSWYGIVRLAATVNMQEQMRPCSPQPAFQQGGILPPCIKGSLWKTLVVICFNDSLNVGSMTKVIAKLNFSWVWYFWEEKAPLWKCDTYLGIASVFSPS